MGRKRKSSGASAASMASGAWASLPTDIVELVTDRLLDGAAFKDYVVFRAVCSAWRACTESMDLRAKTWSIHCQEDARDNVVLVHTPTARRVRVRLPEVRGNMIIGFSDGHLVLLHKRTAAVRVLHPFTRVAAHFPSLAPVYHEHVRSRSSFVAMRATVSAASSFSSIAVWVWFPFPHKEVVVTAKASSGHWEISPESSTSGTPWVSKEHSASGQFFPSVEISGNGSVTGIRIRRPAREA